MKPCDEMIKLRKYLDEKGIIWEDKSDVRFGISRTHFVVKKKKWSVINGLGTYGGQRLFTKENIGLLELMVKGVNGGEPVGWLKAEEIIKYIEEEEKKG